MTRSVTVKAAHDAEAGVWYVEESDLFGLNAEADTLEELVNKLPAVISDLLEPEDGEDAETPVELVVQISTRIQLSSDAA
jgi:predicted RNase H-like HicB family nuclease